MIAAVAFAAFTMVTATVIATVVAAMIAAVVAAMVVAAPTAMIVTVAFSVIAVVIFRVLAIVASPATSAPTAVIILGVIFSGVMLIAKSGPLAGTLTRPLLTIFGCVFPTLGHDAAGGFAVGHIQLATVLLCCCTHTERAVLHVYLRKAIGLQGVDNFVSERLRVGRSGKHQCRCGREDQFLFHGLFPFDWSQTIFVYSDTRCRASL